MAKDNKGKHKGFKVILMAYRNLTTKRMNDANCWKGNIPLLFSKNFSGFKVLNMRQHIVFFKSNINVKIICKSNEMKSLVTSIAILIYDIVRQV